MLLSEDRKLRQIIKKVIKESMGTAFDSLNGLVSYILKTGYDKVEKDGLKRGDKYDYVKFNIDNSVLDTYSKRLSSIFPNGIDVILYSCQMANSAADINIDKSEMRLFISEMYLPIENNRLYREGSIDLLGKMIELYGKDVLHELTHCLNGKTRNGYQEVSYDSFKSDISEDANNLLYLFSKTEMNARVSQVYNELYNQMKRYNNLTKDDFVGLSKEYVHRSGGKTRLMINAGVYGMELGIHKLQETTYMQYQRSCSMQEPNDFVTYLLAFGENEINITRYKPIVKKIEKLTSDEDDVKSKFVESGIIEGENSFNIVKNDMVKQLKEVLSNFQKRLDKLIVRAYQEYFSAD